MLNPIDKEIDGKIYRITSIPAIPCREIMAKYPMSAMPKLGDYAVNEETMLKLMSYVYVNNGGDKWIPLNTPGLVDGNVPTWETLAKIEWEMLQYNCSFLQNGRIFDLLAESLQKLPSVITKILTDSLASLSAKGKQP